jgi:hypothetical protein
MAVATGTALLLGAGATLAAGAMDNRSAKKSIESAEEQKALSQEFIKQQMDQARGDLFKLFPSAQDSQQKGLQAQLGTIKTAFPMQINAFREGNVAAQQTLIDALPQVQNAILGRPMNLGLRAQRINGGVDTAQMPQAPQFQQIQGLGLQLPGMPGGPNGAGIQ